LKLSSNLHTYFFISGAMSSRCALCPEFVAESPSEFQPDGETVQVGAKARSTIVDASRQREDGRDQYLSTAQPLIVHVSCRKVYTRKNTIISHTKNLSPYGDNIETPFRRSTEQRSSKFDITKDCLICGEEANENRTKKGTNKDVDRVCRCETLPFIQKIKTHAEDRNDEIGRKVLCHIATTIDLPAAEAKYHNRCRLNFFRTKKPRSEHIEDKKKAFDFLCDFLKDNSECQYSISELEEIMKENMHDEAEVYTRKHLEHKLKEHFGDSLVVTSFASKPNVLTFRTAFSAIVNKSWYDDRNPDPQSEKQRMARTVAEIVSADIRSMPCECDVYPSPRSLQLNSLQKAVPQTLHSLVERIISQRGRHAQNTTLTQRKSVAIEQAIISATRPSSFLSPLLIGLGVYLHRKYDSENLINMLHAFGFCCSYEEARRYQWSALYGSSPFPTNDDAFVQFVFDNADHNVKSLDGHGTFHSMGSIKCVTPRPERDDSVIITRLQKNLGPAAIGRFGYVPHHQYTDDPKKGLALIDHDDMGHDVD